MKRVIGQLVGAVNTRTLYPAGHTRVRESIDQTVAALASDLEEPRSESLTLLIVGDDLVVDGEVVRQLGLPQRQFIQMLKRHGIERLTLAAGFDEEECDAFIGAVAKGETPEPSPHVVLGHVQVAIEDEGSSDDGAEEESWLDRFDPIRGAFAGFRSQRKLPLESIESLVWGLMDSVIHSTRAILPLAKLKEHDEYTFVHSVNVSLLVLAQARSFGIQEGMLHAFGMAALLHDVGKLMVPLEVLNAPGKLDGEQWVLMQSHAKEGAWYLTETRGATPLSIVVAYEHHLRYDGKPNYPVVKGTRMPNLATRMTSIADTYDALSTVRPYKEARTREQGLKVLQDRVGTFFDPLLVANFIQLVGR